MGNPDETGAEEMTDEKKETKDKWEIAGLCIPAGLFIGMGIGWAYGNLTPGMFIGLGAGFLAMVLVRLKTG
jgi:hypothetical protein